MSFGLLFTQICFATEIASKNSVLLPGEEEPVKKAKSKSFSSHNNSSIKIYPDAFKRIMHVIAKGNKGKEIDFFVFDLQANLIKNYKMKEKDQVKIEGLARGTYVYRVFCGDEETASGNFEIK
jgi:hypothetical protein